MTLRRADPLHGWTVAAFGAAVPAPLAGRPVQTAAPSSGHSALIAAGLIPDPYLGDEEARASWAHRASWRFQHELPAMNLGPDERVDLVFEGIDTFARVRVDDELVAESANMHRTVRIPLDGRLASASVLTVDVEPALEVAEAALARVGPRPAAYPHPYYLVRKMAASFGWDWGPDLQAGGLWRPARLEWWAVARIVNVQPVVRDEGSGRWSVEVRLHVERARTATPLAAVVTIDGAGVHAIASAPIDGDEDVVVLTVDDPQLWWPHDRGPQPLADLGVRLIADGTVVDESTRRVGFRSIRVHQERDEHGTSFALVVNDEPVFVRGLNWIPDDHLIDRVTAADLRERLGQARSANANLIRVWGGGTYESDAFYDICDELGLLVWQDVAMACAGYPESEPLRGEILAEVRENAIRLAPHPSLVVWCGGNENAWGYPQWLERGDIVPGTDWGERYIDEWLPALLTELDPTRPYLPNSPFSPMDDDDLPRWPNDPAHGTYHEWDVWNRDDYTRYRSVVPRFCAEFGFQAPPAWTLMQRALARADGTLDLHSPAFLTHQKADDGMGKLERGLAPHVGRLTDVADWHAAAQSVQALAIRTAVEHYRSHWPVTTGAIVWQLNDCWPSVSWSMIDSDGRPKPVWFALRRAFADRLIAAAPAGDGWQVSLVNDTAEHWRTPVGLRRETLEGTVRTETTIDADVLPRSVQRIDVPTTILQGTDSQHEILVVTADRHEVPVLLAEPIEVAWPGDALTAEALPDPLGWRVRVQTHSAVFGLTLSPDRLDPEARVDDGMLDLPAGSTAEFVVHTVRDDLDPTELIAPPVLRWLGELVSRPERNP